MTSSKGWIGGDICRVRATAITLLCREPPGYAEPSNSCSAKEGSVVCCPWNERRSSNGSFGIARSESEGGRC